MTQSKIVAKIRKLGYKVTVMNASIRNRGGIPDILISDEGRAVFVEIKIDKDKFSKLQNNFREEFFKSWMMLHYDSKTKVYTIYEVCPDNYSLATELGGRLNESQKK